MRYTVKIIKTVKSGGTRVVSLLNLSRTEAVRKLEQIEIKCLERGENYRRGYRYLTIERANETRVTYRYEKK